MGADTNKRTLGGGCALERGHRASLERLAELGESCSGVGALSILDATQRVVSQAVSMAKEECQGALTVHGGEHSGADKEANTPGRRRT